MTFDLDDIEKEMLASSPTSDAPFCCCTLLDPSLGVDQHLHDCELLLLRADINQRTPSEEMSDTSSEGSAKSELMAAAQRRRHRETVARIRHKMRVSIAGLRAQQIRLEEELRSTITGTDPSAQSVPEASGTAELIRVAYFDLVREQIELQDERAQLEATRLLREKYERLVQREVEKARMLGTNQPFTGA